jgi:hypothetical protein
MSKLAKHGSDLTAMVSAMIHHVQNDLVHRPGIGLALQVRVVNDPAGIVLLTRPARKPAQQAPPNLIQFIERGSRLWVGELLRGTQHPV